MGALPPPGKSSTRQAYLLSSTSCMPDRSPSIQKQHRFITTVDVIFARYSLNTKHLYNICAMLGRRCINVIQMFCICWLNREFSIFYSIVAAILNNVFILIIAHIQINAHDHNNL